VIIGIDPRNRIWVSGPDGSLFTNDDNPLGDMTLSTPFEIFFAADIDEHTVQGEYTGRIYIEIIPAP
jgi:hypothetical protein